MTDRDSLVTEYRSQLQRKHKCKEHISFLTECQNANLLPHFTRIPKKAKISLKLSVNQIRIHQQKRLKNALESQNKYLYIINDRITILVTKLGKFMTDAEIKKQSSIFLNQITKFEKYNDDVRLKKLEKLKTENCKEINNDNFVKVDVINYSKKQIPSEIINILSMGLDTAIGGIPRRNNILSKFESFYSSWARHAVISGLDLIKITEIKSLLYLEFLKFCQCSTDSKKASTLKKFLKENDDLSICSIDKSKSIGIFDRDTYLEKLNNIFDSDNYIKLNSNPLKNDLSEMKTLVSEFCEFLTNSDKRKIDPTQNLKKGFGIVKLHRPNAPLRPIISSFNTLTSGSEQFLLNLIKPLVSNCEFSVNSTKEFKERFCAMKDKFNPLIYEVVSFDATALYTNIDIKRTVNFILDHIYRNVEDFFPVTEDTPRAPPRLLTEKFFMNVLLKFNSFETLNGFYKQISGAAMGGKLSGALSNIFLNILEQKIVQKYIKNNKILFYSRYVDDCLVVVRKRYKSQILEEFNNFHKDLKWTVEEMENGQLPFLDTHITLEGSTLNLYQYKKPTASDSLTNYKFAVAPKSYKLGLIAGEVHRANNCTTTEKALTEALDNLEKKLIKNSYPKSIIKQKIQDIKNNDFKPSANKEKRLAEINDPNFTHVTVSLPYTSFRCSSIASNIHKILKKYTPFFKLRFAFSTIRLSNIVNPYLKPRTDYFYNSNLVYQFECDCTKTYIGHTKQYLQKRIYQHKTDNKSHVNQHISHCPSFNQTFFDNNGYDFGTALPRGLNGNAEREYIQSHFSILEKNLHNYHSRTTHEGLLITLYNPDLNKQVFHKTMSFVCECGNYKIENAVGT